MRRGLLVARLLCTVVLIGWGTLGIAMAGEELGQFCWRLEPFVDTVRLSVSVNGPMFHVMASWRAGPAPANQTLGGERNDTRTTWYEFLGTGTGRASIDPREPPGVDKHRHCSEQSIGVSLRIFRPANLLTSYARHHPLSQRLL